MNKPQIGTTEGPQYWDDPLFKHYEPVIGLEVHCQLKSATKLFCSCSTSFGALPNAHTCPVCLGLPGTLPVLNKKAVDYAIMMALAVDATIQKKSVFSRKHYFYPDLPKGYQISQYDKPYSTGGLILLDSGQKIKLTRIHLEEDAGKNVHADKTSYVDLNRAGVPLIEIVSEPDIRTPHDAADYLKKLRSLTRYLDISDGNLEEGSFRCDANISIRPWGQKNLGIRSEIKNLNSFRNIEKAIAYELYRQADILDSGQLVRQETRLFDASTGKTLPMRAKTDAHDYRYFPEPDLGVLVLTSSRIEKIKTNLPELPQKKSQRFQDQYQLTPYDSQVLTAEQEIANFFEEVLRKVDRAVSHKVVANWITSEFLRELKLRNWNLAQPKINSDAMADLLKLIGNKTISGKIAKTVFEEMAESGQNPNDIVREKSLVQITDEKQISEMIISILRSNPKQLEQYLNGKEKLYGFFVGQVMKKSSGKMNPGLVNSILKHQLKNWK